MAKYHTAFPMLIGTLLNLKVPTLLNLKVPTLLNLKVPTLLNLKVPLSKGDLGGLRCTSQMRELLYHYNF
ncbi:MAG: hypothetical protein F6K21_20725 [Symploca sp. SIO2D2]|nr:hypothetical protein [Symploca sp. SIO2D2]